MELSFPCNLKLPPRAVFPGHCSGRARVRGVQKIVVIEPPGTVCARTLVLFAVCWGSLSRGLRGLELLELERVNCRGSPGACSCFVPDEERVWVRYLVAVSLEVQWFMARGRRGGGSYSRVRSTPSGTFAVAVSKKCRGHPAVEGCWLESVDGGELDSVGASTRTRLQLERYAVGSAPQVVGVDDAFPQVLTREQVARGARSAGRICPTAWFVSHP